jgi:phage replication initiation protein
VVPSTDKCIIDYLSVVFDNDELDRLKMLAKIHFEADRERSFQDYYHQLLSPEDISNFDQVLAANVEQFITKLNTTMNKYYYDLKDWEGISGEGFTPNDYQFWTIKNNNFGRFKYDHSANLYFDGQLVGLVCWGCKNYGAMVSFSGQGCGSLNFEEMFKICDDLGYVRISRVDIAHDDFTGTHNVNTCRQMFKNGLFTVTTEPSYQYFESGVLSKSGKLIPCNGRSFYVGKRTSGKMLRCYEKGKQMKDEANPDWNRWEVELRNIDRTIPLDVLKDPHKYFAGAYPALASFSKRQERTVLKVKKLVATYNHLFKYLKQGYAPLMNFAFHALGKSKEEIFDEITHGLFIDDFPKRIKIDALVLST